jgi:hypothetical protein
MWAGPVKRVRDQNIWLVESTQSEFLRAIRFDPDDRAAAFEGRTRAPRRGGGIAQAAQPKSRIR